MFSSPYFTIVITICGIVFAGCELLASYLLLRERSPSAWMMLCGSIIGTLSFAIWTLQRFLPSSLSVGDSLMMLPFYLGYLGHFLFSGGLLWFAFLRRNQGARIAELEAILTAQSTMLNSPRPQSAISKPEIV